MKEIKEITVYLAVAVFFGTVLLGIVYGYRMFSNAATPITVSSPTKGITCASMVTGDGAAISCWKE